MTEPTINTADQGEPLAVLSPVDAAATLAARPCAKMNARRPASRSSSPPTKPSLWAHSWRMHCPAGCLRSGDDLVAVDGALEPAFLDDEGPKR